MSVNRPKYFSHNKIYVTCKTKELICTNTTINAVILYVDDPHQICKAQNQMICLPPSLGCGYNDKTMTFG